MNALLEECLPQVSKNWLEATNQWLLHRSSLKTRTTGGELELSWTNAPFKVPQVLILFELLEHRWAIGLHGLSALDARLHGDPFMAMPEALRTITIQKILADFLKQFPSSLVNNLDSAAVVWNFTNWFEGWESFSFDLKNTTQHTESAGIFAVSKPETLAWLTKQLMFEKPEQRRITERVDCQARLHFGTTDLPIGQIKSLSLGDMIWIETAKHDQQGLWIRLILPTQIGEKPQFAYWKHKTLRLSNDHITQSDIKHNRHIDVKESMDTHIETEQLELPLSFDLGELSLPLADINLLGPNYVFELPYEASEAVVNVRVHGQLIAQGALVVIGRRLGVRLNKIVQADSTLTTNSGLNT